MHRVHNCTRACLNHAIEMVLGKAVVLDSLCIGCMFCHASCSRGAISVTSRFVPKGESETLRTRAAVIGRQLKLIEKRLKSITK